MKKHIIFASVPRRWSFTVLSLGALALAASGCTTLHAELPASRFESPETNGTEHRFKVGSSLEAAHDYTVTPDASQRPPDFSQPKIDDLYAIGLAGSFGVVENLDLSVRTTFGPSPTMLIAKFQILGPDSRTAKKGDVSLAVTGAIGGGRSSISGEQSGLFGPGGHKWTGSIEEQTTDAAVIIGQRLADHVLLYAGGFYSDYHINGSIDQSQSDDGLSPAASYSPSTTGYQSGGNLGVQFIGGGGFIQIEGVYSTVHVANMGHTLLKAALAGGVTF